MDRRRIWIALGIIAVLVIIAGFSLWWFLLRSDAPEAVSLEGAVATVTSSSTTLAPSSGDTTQEPTTTTTTTADPDPGSGGIEGDWTLLANGTSFAGYRVEEELGTIGVTTAVGRSPEVAGSLRVEDQRVVSVDVVVDMTALASDDSRRDGAIRRQALETDTFPEAGFSVTTPIELPEGAAAGTAFAIEAEGELTLHGVTRTVTIPLEAQLVDGAIVVVGSLPIAFSDYDIETPRAAILLSVDDVGVMEFQLVFAQIRG